MRFRCSVGKLIDGLQIATKALAQRTTNQILEGVLIETDADQVILTCSDERITIVTRIDAEIEEPGRGVAPGRLFNDIIRRMLDGDVLITMNDKCIFNIRSSASKMNISGQDADLFPHLPKLENERSISLPQDMLRDMIQKTEFAIAVDDMREVLTGCLLEIENGNVNMVALDGYRLALCRMRCSEVSENFSAIIPGRAIGEIGKLLSDQEEAFANLTFGDGKLHIGLNETDVYVILVAGQYVNYRQILPKSFSTKVVVNLESFRRCVDRAQLIAREGNANLLILKIADGTLVVEAHSQIGDVREELDIQQEGANMNIAFNVKYLLDVVRYIDAEQIEIHLNNAVSPCIINPVGNNDYIHLVLPVRTGATNA